MVLDGVIPHHAEPFLLAFAIAGGLAQFSTGFVLWKKGNVAGGGLFTAFGLFFLGAPSAIIFMATQGFGSIHGLHWILGYWNIILGLFLWVWAIAFVHVGWFEFLISPLGGIALVSAGIGNLTGNLIPLHIGAYIFYFFVFWALYMLAHSLGESVGIHVPIGRPLRKPSPEE